MTDPPPAFRLLDVSLSRGGARILTQVTAAVPAGGVTALVGPSGSGKSSLLRLLNRFDDPDSGRVFVAGTDVRDVDVLDLRRRVGLVAQRPVLLAPTIAAELRVGHPDLTLDEVGALLRRVGLDHLDPDRTTAGLSGGETQRLAFARALALQPEVLLLDEPTSALDSAAADTVLEVVSSFAASGLTVLVVSHDLARLADVAAHAIVLEGGSVVDEGPTDAVEYLGGN